MVQRLNLNLNLNLTLTLTTVRVSQIVGYHLDTTVTKNKKVAHSLGLTHVAATVTTALASSACVCVCAVPFTHTPTASQFSNLFGGVTTSAAGLAAEHNVLQTLHSLTDACCHHNN